MFIKRSDGWYFGGFFSDGFSPFWVTKERALELLGTFYDAPKQLTEYYGFKIELLAEKPR